MIMRTIRVTDVLQDRILVSRESARLLESAIVTALERWPAPSKHSDEQPIALDFEGVEGMAPSFLDELLLILGSLMAARGHGGLQDLIVTHPPTRLSRKFEAVARGHNLSAGVQPDGSWRLTPSPDRAT